MGAVWKVRREVLAVAGIAWLAGFHFFFDGFYHMAAFWLVLAPLAVVNLDLLGHRKGRRWQGLLATVVAWQFLCSLRIGGPWGGLPDAVGVILLVVAVMAMLEVPWGRRGFRGALCASAVITSAWALVSFYPMSDLGLEDERLRNVLVYPIGLNAVLTGLLIGFSMVAGLGLCSGKTPWRWVVRTGLAVLGFSLMATQSRGALLATAAGAGVMLWVERRTVLADLAGVLAGVAAYLVVFAVTASEGGPDLVERGATGRIEIWETYFGSLRGTDWLIGQGRVPALEESVLGWFVHHPHGSWVSQVVWCGIPGLLLLATFIGCAAIAGWRIRTRDAVPLALLVFGVTGLLFDGAQVVSLASVPRIEPLLVLVPAVLALGLKDRMD